MVARDVKTVGYIGLGNAGFSMASNLPKNGYSLVVYDQDQKKVTRAVGEWKNTSSGASTSGTLDGQAFQECDVVITMLPHGGIVRDVLLPQGTESGTGLESALKPGTIVVDTSSSSPFETQALGKDLHQKGIHLIDSPITQTYMHATDAGQSTLIVGCDEQEHFDTVKPVLECMASYIFHMGPLGAGHAMKTLNNYIMASSICALSDSLVTGQKFGLDPQKMIDVLNVGTGVNFPTLDTFRRDALTRNFNSGFGLALLVKDLGITQKFMQHSAFETKLPGLLKEYLSHSLHVIGPERARVADHTECIRGWEERAGGGLTIRKTESVKDIPAQDFEHRRLGLNRK